MTPWEALLRRLQSAARWPLPSEADLRVWLTVWAALRENDQDILRKLMKWPADRPLILDNLGEKMPSAFGDLLFGEPPTFTASDEADQDRMVAMTEGWIGDLNAAEETCTSEGEVWWRLSTSADLPHPVLTWHSRLDVVPMLHGRNELAIAFVDHLPTLGDASIVWRHVELHGVGIVLNLLFRGTPTTLGQQVALTQHPETELISDRWETNVPMLLGGRIVNRWGRKATVGQSIYKGVWQRLLALTESTTVGRENMRLTAKKRIVVSGNAVRSQGLPSADDPAVQAQLARGQGVAIATPRVQFDAGEDVLVNDPLDVDEGASQRDPYRVLEYSFEADQLVTWMRFEIETICQRCDLVPAFIGNGDFGSAESGTALQVRLLPTVNAAESRGGRWDSPRNGMPHIQQAGALLEAQPRVYGGFGVPWAEPGGVHAMTRSSALPVDEDAQATRLATLRTADLVGILQALRELYPGQDDQWYVDRREEILADIAATMPAGPTFGA